MARQYSPLQTLGHRVTLLLVIGVLISGGCSSQRSKDDSQTPDVAAFVASFYDTYPAAAIQPTATPAWVGVASSSDSVLTSELANALGADFQASRTAQGEVAGLDFDPFLNSQDPCDSYRVEGVAATSAGYRAEIFGDCREAGDPVPDVIAEVVLEKGYYRFSDFFYPPSPLGLLALLRSLQEPR